MLALLSARCAHGLSSLDQQYLQHHFAATAADMRGFGIESRTQKNLVFAVNLLHS